jgi:hypothetical protein
MEEEFTSKIKVIFVENFRVGKLRFLITRIREHLMTFINHQYVEFFKNVTFEIESKK